MFPATRRSVILALSSDDVSERRRAFDTLVTLYWKPLYKYARVALGRQGADAEDVTQGFLARAFESGVVSQYDSTKASFRTFLRMLFDRHVLNDVKAASRIKRGGGDVHLDFDSAELEIAREHDRSGTPADYFQREWVRSVFALSVDRLRAEYCAAGKQEHFAMFEAYDLDGTAASYRETAERFGVPETSVTNWLSAARRRFRAIVLEVLREATVSEHEYRTEVRSILGIEV
ncbi:MAG: sigma-70 family RNA polymerase sigma factor [Acidobacteriota bacterium]